jgi:hypothetical protein
VFGIINATLRAFVVGVVVGALIAPRPGAETRRMLNEKLSAMLNQILELAALPPIEPTQAATNGQTERSAVKRTRSAEGPGARATT